MRFLDTNVLIRFFIGTPVEQYRRSVELLHSIERGHERIVLNHIVIFEAVWVLNRSYEIPTADIETAIMGIINLPNVHLENKRLYARAFELSIDLNIPFADAYCAAFMEENDIEEAYTWDRHFERIPGINRVEPAAPELN